MGIGVSEEHEELRRTVRRWLDANWPSEVARAGLEASADELPVPYKELAAQGWLGLHVDERFGGDGFGVVELAVVLEELGWSCVPGPLLPTLVLSGLVSALGDDGQRSELLAGLVDGTDTAAVYVGQGALGAEPEGDGELRISGTLRPVLGLPTASRALVPVSSEGGPVEWCVLDVRPDAAGVEVKALTGLDPSRPLGELTVTGAIVPAGRRLRRVTTEDVNDLSLVLSAAENAGGARWCLETTSEYAKVRVQFGRPIGQFQAVKHRLADMLVAVEQSAATAWDAALAWDTASGKEPGTAGTGERALAVAVAGTISTESYLQCAKDCVQLHGGIGFTWEHDAHRYLRRAMATKVLLPGAASLRERVTELAGSGARRSLDTSLPSEADAIRREVAPLIARAQEVSGRELRELLVDHGLVGPHWPRPWGRDAGALEQIVIDEEMDRCGVQRPYLMIGAWAMPTLMAHGTPDQQERWIRPTLVGDLMWCQLFSEPGAGSDLASLSTKAERVEGGWRLYGQKVWTSLAQEADLAICLARSDPVAPKHDGITYFVVDMHAPGIEVRPLRELTGTAMFNEVFLDGVFVPDGDVVGKPGGGWRIARTTLTNERVSLASGSTFGSGVETLLGDFLGLGDSVPATVREALGALLAEAHCVRLLGHRTILRSLVGADPGPGASVRKLLAAEHEQRIQELGLLMCGSEAAVMEGRAARWGQGFLATRCLTIAGGTSEVQRNVIAERLLGLPRDPDPEVTRR